MPKERHASLQCRSGVSTIEYVVLVVAFAIGVPVLASQVMPFLQGRTCEANQLLDGTSCIGVSARDHEATTYKGVPVAIDLLAGANVTVREVRAPAAGAAHAQEGPDYTEIVGGGGEDGIVTGSSRLTLESFTQPVRREIRSARSLVIGTGGTRAGEGRGEVVFDPLSDFAPLRSDESAVVTFEYTLADPSGQRASARATVTVLGFHADDDVATGPRTTPFPIDVLANDHLPDRRNELTIVSVTQPDRGSVEILDDRILFLPGPDFNHLPDGSADLVEFSYEVEGPQGLRDTARVSVTVDAVPLSGAPPVIVKVATTDFAGCGLSSIGEVWCWGVNSAGVLGRGHLNSVQGSERNPRRVVAPQGQSGYLSNVVDIEGDRNHMCAIVGVGRFVYCWGLNTHGQLGAGDTVRENPFPRPVIQQDGSRLSGISALSAGYFTTCGYVHGGFAYCWGDNTYGVLGRGATTSTTDRTRAAPVMNIGRVKDISVGQYLACAISPIDMGNGRNVDAVRCWGSGSRGSRGDGTDAFVNSSSACHQVRACNSVLGCCSGFTRVDGITIDARLDVDFKRVFVGSVGGCAIVADSVDLGDLYCWGVSETGQNGIGRAVTDLVPFLTSSYAPIGAVGVTDKHRNTQGGCFATGAGQVWCWGLVRVGDIRVEPALAPIEITSALPAGGFRRLSAGASSEICLYNHPRDVARAGASLPGIHCGDITSGKRLLLVVFDQF